MGLRQVAPWGLLGALLLAPAAVAAPHEPVVFAVGWGHVDEQFFPHAALCVGEPGADRQRAVGPGYLFDPDGCGDATRAVLIYADADRSGTFTPRDTLYVGPAGQGVVEEGILRVSTGAVEPVARGEPDTGASVRPLPGGIWDFVDIDGSERWSTGDVAYYDADESGYLSPGDLRLQADLRMVPLDTPGMALKFEQAEGGLCYLDDDGSGIYDKVEPVYLVVGRPCGNVGTGDLRVVATRGLEPGSRVIEAHLDFRNPLMSFADGSLVAFDATGEQGILDLDGSGSITPGDRRFAPGFPVLNRTGTDVLEPTSAWSFVDVDRTGAASDADLYYLDRDGDGRASIGDIRATEALGKAMGSIVQDGDVDATTALPQRADADPVPVGSPTTATDDGAAGSEDAPAVGFVLLVPMGFLAFVAARRSRFSK